MKEEFLGFVTDKASNVKLVNLSSLPIELRIAFHGYKPIGTYKAENLLMAPSSITGIEVFVLPIKASFWERLKFLFKGERKSK